MAPPGRGPRGRSPRSLNLVARDLSLDALAPAALHRCGALAELPEILGRQPDAAGPAYLDLSAHSTRGHRYLRFGGDVLDLLDRKVERFFQRLSEEGALRRRSIVAVRLLGCETAVGPASRLTMRRLARVLKMPVYGTLKPIRNHHYCERGFRPEFETLLMSVEERSPLATRGERG